MTLVKKPSLAKKIKMSQMKPPSGTFVVSPRPTARFRPALIRLRWSMEQPRKRTLLVGSSTRRVEFRRPTYFLHSKRETDGFSHHYLFAWSGGEPGKGVLTPSTPLYVSSMHAPGCGATHVYANGFVCFNGNATKLMQQGRREPIDVFWSSSMHVLPRWITAVEESDRVEPDAAWLPATINYGMSSIRMASGAPGYSPEMRYTPELVTSDLIRLHTGGESSIIGYEVTAPWLATPEYYDEDGVKQ